jgi:osmoprotectant transport system permease protein
LDSLIQAWVYASSHSQELAAALGQHIMLVGIALSIATLLGIPLGVAAARSRLANTLAINLSNGLRVIPSLAILFLMLPYFGLSMASSIIALVVLALPPILLNTDAAFRSIDPAIREAGAGMGMSVGQLFWRVEAPLALPVVLTGFRTATVEVIASATLAAFIGGGGLGIFITRGFALYDAGILLVGAVPVALLAITAELGLGAVEKSITTSHRQGIAARG